MSQGDAAAVEHAAGAERTPSQYLTFALDGKRFAVAIRHVREIIEYDRLTAIPLLPAFIRGVINRRGSAVPVIDLGVRLGGRPTEVGKRSCIVIVETAADDEESRRDIGVLVDAVAEVIAIPANQIEAPPSFGAGVRADFIAGVGKVAGELVVIIDLDQVLAVDAIAALNATLVSEISA